MPLWLFLACAVTHRLTRLVTRDSFPPVARLRDKIRSRYVGRWQGYLVTCDWCVSIWLGGLVILALSLYVADGLHQSWWPWPLWLGSWAATSSVTGLVATWEERSTTATDAARVAITRDLHAIDKESSGD